LISVLLLYYTKESGETNNQLTKIVPAIFGALILSFPLNYIYGWMAGLFKAFENPQVDSSTRKFKRIMIFLVSTCNAGILGISCFLSLEKGNMWIISIAACLLIDAILDCICVSLCRRYEQVFKICQRRGFYQEDISARETKIKRRPSKLPKRGRTLEFDTEEVTPATGTYRRSPSKTDRAK
jgi:hypothetical protein